MRRSRNVRDCGDDMNQRLVVQTTTSRPSEIKTCCLTFEHWLTRRSGGRKFGYNNSNRTVSFNFVILITTTFLVLLSDYAQCMEFDGVTVPEYPEVGSRQKLWCNYRLNGDNLYSVKWYKDAQEFYRYVPRDDPPSQVFSVQWIRVDVHQSNDRWVMLHDLELSSSGRYTCEVSSEAPRFKTVDGTSHMKVIDLPDDIPILRHNLDTSKSVGGGIWSGDGGGPGYRVGDTLEVNCTSLRSHPAAKLRWYLNGEPVDSSYVSEPAGGGVISEGGGLFTATKRLHLVLRRKHFQHSRVIVKCTADLGLGKGGTSGKYFQSNYLEFRGIGLGEKALGISANGAANRHEFTNSIAVALGILMIFSTVVN